MPTVPQSDLQAKLEASRKDLLDLTFRNPLLNYRPLKARGVEVIDSDADFVYQTLVGDGKKMSFVATELERRPVDGVEPEPGSAVEELIPTASTAVSEEPARRRRSAADLLLQTASTPADLQKRLLKTLYTARTFIEEQGVNTLFLALGMLDWSEPGAVAGASGTHRSPLALVPVEIERRTISDRFTIRYSDEEIIGNVSLATYLAAEFGVELPLPPPDREDLDVALYLEQVALIVGGKSGWTVDSSAVALAFFSFNKYLMYKELEDDAWPEGRSPVEHRIIGSLLGGDGFREPEERIAVEDHLDRMIAPADSRLVMDADSSQMLAIEDVKQGRDLVIQGPPGTGKSQTITNIVAESLGQGKTILFVSEKMAALEVVKQRLDRLGLGDACLELHSNKTSKKAVLAELKRTLDLGRPVLNGHGADDVELLVAARDRLNAYCDAVNTPVRSSGLTAHTLFGEWLRIQSTFGNRELPGIELSASYADWTSLEYRRRLQVVEELEAHLGAMGVPVEHPFWGADRAVYVSTDAGDFRRVFDEAAVRASELEEAVTRLALKLSLPMPTTANEAEALAGAVQRSIEAPMHEGLQFSSRPWLARRADLDELIDLGAHMTDARSRFDAMLVPEAWDRDVLEARQAIAEHSAKWWRFLIGDWRNAGKQLRLVCQSSPPTDPAAQLALLDAILDYRRTKVHFNERSELGATLFGAQWQGERSDWLVLRQLLHWIVDMHREVGDGKLPEAFLDFLSGNADLQKLIPDVAAVQTALPIYREQARKTIALLELREEVRFGVGGRLVDQPFVEQKRLFTSWSQQISLFQQMTTFNHLAARCREMDIEGVVRTAAVAKDGNDTLAPAFAKSYYQSLLRLVFQENANLAHFSGATHSEVIGQFRELDRRLLDYNRRTLAAEHWQSIRRANTPLSQAQGQLRVLTREFEKKSRHLAIRQLIENAGNAIQAIKPVLMMSPLSVATFLSPGHLKFDLIVFDEASQVKPVDALGALARGEQAVVVGDSRQLPPSSFFDTLAQSDGLIDEDNETADLESILGLFVGQGAPQRMLQWHYRSRHESLIAVSNQEFYDGKLVVFPSPDAAREKLGLVYRHLPDTVYDRGGNGTNRLEAEAVAAAAMEHARAELAKPAKERRTLGIAAFSMGQMEAIIEQVDSLRQQNPDCEPFFSGVTHEPFFVKNLENVQGDERDVIFISIGYGRDKNGTVSVNFGPLNKLGGERRLNVLITRARLRCEVFTNMLPEDINLSRTGARGVEALQTFLRYARSGALDGEESVAERAPATQFESEVLAVLRDAGCEVAAQVGCAGYFIDLAVVDPEKPGSYLVGIECDGPNYYDARSARDRDRLRGEVLAAMGWRLHRIWSTDWIHRYDSEKARLLAAIEAARSASDEPEPSIEAQPSEDEPIEADSPDAETTDPPAPVMERVAEPREEDAVAPYTVAVLPPSRHLDINDYSNYGAVADLVVAVVDVESPIHWHEVSRRAAGALGVQRITDAFHGKVGAAAAIAERHGRIRKSGMFFWLPDMHEPVLRSRATLDGRFRNLDLIAPEEVQAAVTRVVSASYGMPLTNVARGACRVLGIERVTADTSDQVGQIAAVMIEGGVLQLDNGIVTIATR